VLASLGVLVAPRHAAAESAPASLPRQFSVEVGAGGALFADGTRLGAQHELSRWAQRAVASSRYAGAVVFGDPEREGRVVADALEILRRAGFTEVRDAGRPAPPELSAAARVGSVPALAVSKPAGVPSPPASQPKRPPVTLATVGLHVGGKLNQEPHRSRLVKVFEQQFAAFRRCHPLAEKHELATSFGVDLLVPKGGGRGKVRETRTRFESKAFRTCMHGAFEAIRFAPPPTERPEVVSYSVSFKPAAR
jgi:hypothetical protein